MKPLSILGFIIIAIGASSLLYSGITFMSSRNVVDLGPVHLEVQESRPFPVTAVGGLVAVLAGMFFVLADKRSRQVRINS